MKILQFCNIQFAFQTNSVDFSGSMSPLGSLTSPVESSERKSASLSILCSLCQSPVLKPFLKDLLTARLVLLLLILYIQEFVKVRCEQKIEIVETQ